MSMKDEIEKIIQVERKKLESRAQETRLRNERQCERFRPIVTILDELIASLDSAYMEADVWNDRARIEVGRHQRYPPAENDDDEEYDQDATYFEIDMSWTIEPTLDLQYYESRREVVYVERPGFTIAQTDCRRRLNHDTRKFDTAEEAIRFLISKIAERIASLQYLNEQPA